MTLQDKSKASINLAYRLESEGELNMAANRFYYSIFQKTLHYAEERGYSYSNLSKEERKGSHNSLINHINKLISEERKRNPGNKNLNNINSIQHSFNSIKKLRVKADYESDNITPEDIVYIKDTLDDFNNKYSLLKQNI